MNLLPFAQKVKIVHKYLEYENGWITNTRPSYFNGHNWQYEIRTDQRLRSGYFLNGGEWFDEMDLEPIDNGELPMSINIEHDHWPPNIGRRPGIWGINGAGVNHELIDKMLSWNPGAITCFYDYLVANGVDKYSDVPIIIRFQHDKNWHENPSENARNKSFEIISKWPTIKDLNPYVYFANEMNLHYENGDDNVGNQHLYESIEFYEKYANWVTELADRIKQQIPEMRLVCPPFAYGHMEDGEPDDDGLPKNDYVGYEFLLDAIDMYFDNIICGHYYWGNHNGSNRDWLYGDDSKWHAFRWKKVLSLFENYFNQPVKMIIDECGNFATTDDDFAEQLIYYAENTLKDSRIIAMTYFLFHDPTNSPGNMPNSWQRIGDLDSFLQRMKNMANIQISLPYEPPSQEPELPIEIPPPVEIPPEEPPPIQNVSMTIERGDGLHLIVGDWLEPDVELEFFAPSGNHFFVHSGTKSEFGNGGFEIYAPEWGGYILYVDNYEFTIPMSGQFTKLHFERTGEPLPVMVRLVSESMTEESAHEMLIKLEQLYPGKFRIDN